MQLLRHKFWKEMAEVKTNELELQDHNVSADCKASFQRLYARYLKEEGETEGNQVGKGEE